MKRILSLDGGGIRGALTLGYLKKIETILAERSPNSEEFRLCHYFDLIGGTSTGSIIAAGLAVGMTVDQIKDMYMQLGGKIFGKSYDWWKPWETGKYLKSEFSSKPLETELKAVFKDITLGSSEILTNLCVVAKRADTNSTWLLNNNPNSKFHNSELGRNKDILLWQALRASSAAPTYFVPQIVDVGNGVKGAFVDGGVSPANNPAFDLFQMISMKGHDYNWDLGEDKLFILSVGTGSSEYFLKTNEVTDNWLLKWAKEVPSMLMADASLTNQTMLQWLGKTLTPKEIDMAVGDFENENLYDKSLFTYARFNSTLSMEYLNDLGIGNFDEEMVESLKEMSNSENRELLYEIGEAAGKNEINEKHLPRKFDK